MSSQAENKIRVLIALYVHAQHSEAGNKHCLSKQFTYRQQIIAVLLHN